jgi:putative ABC transport system ATP-binding protein
MPLIRVRDGRKHYTLDKALTTALDGVSLDIDAGERVALMGPSGSGKSTLLNLMGCLDRLDGGSLEIDGQDTKALRDVALSRFRNRTMGFIFQSFNLIPVLSVHENIEYPLLLQEVSASERRDRVEQLLEQVGLAGFGRRSPENLSGGQRQRVAIARALVTRPRIVFADEPTAALDQKTGRAVMELMVQMNEKAGATLVFSTHDATVAGYARRVVKLLDGKIAEDGGAA